MKRRIAILSLTLVILFAFAGYAQSGKAVSGAQLKSILVKATKAPIKYFQTVDIGNSQNAAFAIVAGDQSYEGDAWYVTASKAQRLQKNIQFPDSKNPIRPAVWTVNGTKLFKYESSAGGSSSGSFAWYIKNGKPVKLPYTGMNLSYAGNGQFTTEGEAFDWNYTDGMGTGHTYKAYYLYWTAGGLKEYGGLKITRQQLLKIHGAQPVIDVLDKAGKTIDAIYYRANNILNINYHTGNKTNGNYDNVTLLDKNNTVKPVLVYPAANGSKIFSGGTLSNFSYGGIYQAALFPKIATYPASYTGGSSRS